MSLSHFVTIFCLKLRRQRTTLKTMELWLKMEVYVFGVVQSELKVHHSRANELYIPSIVLRGSLQVRFYILWRRLISPPVFSRIKQKNHDLRDV